jgi:thymidine phosphorylase
LVELIIPQEGHLYKKVKRKADMTVEDLKALEKIQEVIIAQGCDLRFVTSERLSPKETFFILKFARSNCTDGKDHAPSDKNHSSSEN